MDLVSYSGIVRNYKEIRPWNSTAGGGLSTFDIFQPNSLREFKGFEFNYHLPDYCTLADGKYIEFTADDKVIIQLTKLSSAAPDNAGSKFLEIATDTTKAATEVRALLDTLPLTFQVEELNHLGKIFVISIKDGAVVDGGLEAYSIQRLKENLMIVKNASFIYRQGNPVDIYSLGSVNRKSPNKPLQEPKAKKESKKPTINNPDTWDFI